MFQNFFVPMFFRQQQCCPRLVNWQAQRRLPKHVRAPSSGRTTGPAGIHAVRQFRLGLGAALAQGLLADRGVVAGAQAAEVLHRLVLALALDSGGDLRAQVLLGVAEGVD